MEDVMLGFYFGRSKSYIHRKTHRSFAGRVRRLYRSRIQTTVHHCKPPRMPCASPPTGNAQVGQGGWCNVGGMWDRSESQQLRHSRGLSYAAAFASLFHASFSITTRTTTMSQQGVHAALGNIPRVVVRPTVDNVVASTYLVKVFGGVLLLSRMC